MTTIANSKFKPLQVSTSTLGFASLAHRTAAGASSANWTVAPIHSGLFLLLNASFDLLFSAWKVLNLVEDFMTIHAQRNVAILAHLDHIPALTLTPHRPSVKGTRCFFALACCNPGKWELFLSKKVKTTTQFSSWGKRVVVKSR